MASYLLRPIGPYIEYFSKKEKPTEKENQEYFKKLKTQMRIQGIVATAFLSLLVLNSLALGTDCLPPTALQTWNIILLAIPALILTHAIADLSKKEPADYRELKDLHIVYFLAMVALIVLNALMGQSFSYEQVAALSLITGSLGMLVHMPKFDIVARPVIANHLKESKKEAEEKLRAMRAG